MARRPPDDLTDEVRELIAPHLEPDVERLATIGQMIAAKWEEAKRARESSGIEEIWTAAEEAYAGIDEMNRAEFGSQRWSKPPSSDGPLTRDTAKTDDSKSTAFVRLTARYVDAGAAKLSEILLPPDDKPFKISETPVPEVVAATEDPNAGNTGVLLDNSQPAMRPAKPEEVPQNPAAGQPAAAVAAPAAGGAVPPAVGAGGPPMVQITKKDLAEENVKLASDKAKKAEDRIYDWMVECQYTAEVRKVIFDRARLGVGVLKAPFAKPHRGMAVLKNEDGSIKLEVKNSVKPAATWVDPWNIYPDPACGEKISDGSYCFEVDMISERQVQEFKRTPGYISSQIDKVLIEGPGGVKLDTNYKKPNRETTGKLDEHRYQIRYFVGSLNREDMACICEAAGKPLKGVAKDRPEVFAIVTSINGHVIKAAVNPLDTGSINYHNVPWQRRTGHWAGIGVAEQIATPQKMVNAATRAMLNNAGIAGGVQIVIDRDGIKPGNGDWRITPNKIWIKASDQNMNVDQAFGMFQIPNVVEAMMVIIQYAMRLAEESTSIPLVTQGHSGPTQPQTLGGMQLQDNNANQLLRWLGYSHDDFVTDPVVRLWYEWLLLDPDVPNDEKGDFTINAHGSAALVERAIQDQVLVQILPASLQPAYGLNPKRTMDEFLKSKRFDPRAMKNTEEEQKQIDSQPPPVAPQIEAAKIGAASREKIAGLQDATDKDKIHSEGVVALHDIKQRREDMILEYALKRGITIEQVKAAIAQTAMKLDTQKELSADGGGSTRVKRVRSQRSGARPAPQVAAPPSEPAGQAPAGRAFQA